MYYTLPWLYLALLDSTTQTNNTHREMVAAVQTRIIFGTGAPTSEEQASQTFHQDDTIASQNPVPYVNRSPIYYKLKW